MITRKEIANACAHARRQIPFNRSQRHDTRIKRIEFALALLADRPDYGWISGRGSIEDAVTLCLRRLGLAECKACREHYGDEGVCDLGRPAGSPHRQPHPHDPLCGLEGVPCPACACPHEHNETTPDGLAAYCLDCGERIA